MCQFLSTFLKNFEKLDEELSSEKFNAINEHIQKEIDALQAIYWSIPI
jgi:hypothetical protein